MNFISIREYNDKLRLTAANTKMVNGKSHTTYKTYQIDLYNLIQAQPRIPSQTENFELVELATQLRNAAEVIDGQVQTIVDGVNAEQYSLSVSDRGRKVVDLKIDRLYPRGGQLFAEGEEDFFLNLEEIVSNCSYAINKDEADSLAQLAGYLLACAELADEIGEQIINELNEKKSKAARPCPVVRAQRRVTA